jgi:hypothetical protein
MMLIALIAAELIVWSFILMKDRRLIKSKMKVQLWLLTHLRNIFRSNNSAAKDLRLIRQMVPDIKLYFELSGGNHSVYVKNGIKASNRLFRFTKHLLISSLYAATAAKKSHN